MVETQFSKHIKIFRFDNALENTQYAFQAILYSYNTIHQLTCLGISQQNGRSEWKFRHILDIIRALLLSAKVLTHFWDKATLHVVHAINRIPSLVIQNQIPYERFFRSLPKYQHLCSFGSACFIFLHMSIIDLSLNLGFAVFLVMMQLKRGFSVMILSLIVFISLAMLSFGNITTLSSFFTSMPPYLPSCLKSFSRWAKYTFYNCS